MSDIKSVVAREDNGNIQITFTVPWNLIQKEQEETLKEYAKDVVIPGFRKGKAPYEKVKEKVSQEAIIQHSLSHILPKALSEVIKKDNLKIALYPKYELISAKENEDWQIRANTCELPEVKLGNYKEKIKFTKDTKPEEKEQIVIKVLLDNIKIDMAPILVEEEVNSRLTNLLARIEKLGLKLENYLSSVGKNPETLRQEYEQQAKESIALDLILSKIAQEEKLKIDEKEVNEAFSVAQASANKDEDPIGRKIMIESILKKREALKFLINLPL